MPCHETQITLGVKEREILNLFKMKLKSLSPCHVTQITLRSERKRNIEVIQN